MTIDCREAENEHFGKCRFTVFPSLFSGSSGFGGRVGSLDAKLSEQGGAEVSFSVSPDPQCPGSEQGKQGPCSFCLLGYVTLVSSDSTRHQQPCVFQVIESRCVKGHQFPPLLQNI